MMNFITLAWDFVISYVIVNLFIIIIISFINKCTPDDFQNRLSELEVKSEVYLILSKNHSLFTVIAMLLAIGIIMITDSDVVITVWLLIAISFLGISLCIETLNIKD